GVGKTTLQAWLVLWFLCTRKNCKVPVAANSQDQLRDTIWPEIAKWHRQLPVPLSDLGPDRIAQLILRVRRYRDFAVLACTQKPQHKPRLQRGLADAVARSDGHAIMLADSF
ncbi:MAG TPA: hypothetical protein VHP35_01925, partial [Terriglobia bacterium]|nr:hypothetical protein [Terriglobia bacterium]